MSSVDVPSYYKRPLVGEWYNLDSDETAFFKQQTGIQDDEELKTHVLAVQKKAFEVHPYPCIRSFAFTKLKISRIFCYTQLLELSKKRPDAILLDIGCCFGNDLRKAIADGYPAEDCIGSDLVGKFYELGHELFRTTPETFAVPFIAGDAFNPEHLAVVPPFTPSNAPRDSPPDLKSLASLNPLHGRVSAIHASSFFHLFQEKEQGHLAHALAGLLAPEPGSMIFGSHVGLPEKGFLGENAQERRMFCHGPQSWEELWNGEVFEKGQVKVDTKLVEVKRPEMFESDKMYILQYCVTRL